MRCPRCRFPNAGVYDSRPTGDEARVRRRRRCSACGHRFTTLETEALVALTAGGPMTAQHEGAAFQRAQEMTELCALLPPEDVRLVLSLARRLADAATAPEEQAA